MLKPKESTRELLAPVAGMTIGEFARICAISPEVNFLNIGKVSQLRIAARYINQAIKNN